MVPWDEILWSKEHSAHETEGVARVFSRIKIFSPIFFLQKRKKKFFFFFHEADIPSLVQASSSFGLDSRIFGLHLTSNDYGKEERRKKTVYSLRCAVSKYADRSQRALLSNFDGSSNRSGCYYTFEALAVDPFILSYVILRNRKLFQMWRSILSTPDLYVIINGHGWLATRVVLWFTVSKTWTVCMNSGLGIDSVFVVIVVSSWSDILCLMRINECESRMVPFMTLQYVAGKGKCI